MDDPTDNEENQPLSRREALRNLMNGARITSTVTALAFGGGIIGAKLGRNKATDDLGIPPENHPVLADSNVPVGPLLLTAGAVGVATDPFPNRRQALETAGKAALIAAGTGAMAYNDMYDAIVHGDDDEALYGKATPKPQSLLPPGPDRQHAGMTTSPAAPSLKKS